MLRTNLSILHFIENLHATSGGEVQPRTFTPGSALLTQGYPAAEVLIIRGGVTKCFFSEENGKDYILEFLGEGEIVGEIEAIRGTHCLCNVQAITEVTAFGLRSSFFGQLFTTDLGFAQLLMHEMAERIANTAARSSAQQLYTIDHGLRRMLAFQDRQKMQLSKADMAAYLGITLRSLNRALKNMD